MHFDAQPLAVNTNVETFKGACAQIGINLTSRGFVDSREDMLLEIGDESECAAIAIQDRCGQTIVWDDATEFVLSPDIAIAISKVTKAKTLAGAFQSASGYYYFVIADEGQVKRIFCACYMQRQDTYEIGQITSSEGIIQLDKSDGSGIELAFISNGFDIESARSGNQYEICTYEKRKLPRNGKYDLELEEFLSNS